ncbi:hypothetical protein H0E84_02085 [Luteimonas sp. SJ-92]|uniref:Uncharacterized protein n=1 Tax=Luteimonas salinisoli TaxID=2752307 RepID=A0A853J937_9GAMM|nr:hypothetical protein [Luteimonas salinisoli]NZA25160.1 hypothetical protein [Luteimonas salinisoli]
MGRIDSRPLVWALHRGYLRRGAAFVLCLLVASAAVLTALLAGAAWWQLKQADREVAARTRALSAAPSGQGLEEKSEPLQLPASARRFDINARILAGLEEAGFAPQQIRFRFEDVDEAELIRQTAIFELTAGWSEIANALAGLQATDRAVYISKLRLERETPGAALVTAEIEVAAAMVGKLDPEEAAP